MGNKIRILENKFDFYNNWVYFITIVLHLNEVNLRQYNLSNIIHLFTTQILLSLIIFIFSLLINSLIFKKFF